MPRAYACVFGGWRLETPDGTPIPINNKRASLCLAILCLQPDLSIERETLANLLWPDRFPAQAKASLRQCLHDLGRLFCDIGLDALLITRTQVSLEPNAIACDLFDLQIALENGESELAVEHLLAIGNQALLQGVTLNPAFDSWIAARRNYFDARLKAALADALSQADAALRARLGEAARARFPTFHEPASGPRQVTIAVLPIALVDEIGGEFLLADGITDELHVGLSRLEGSALVARTSILAVTEEGGTLPEMARALAASHLVDGEVRRGPETITVRVALVDGKSGTELWLQELTGSVDEFVRSRTIIGATMLAEIARVLGLALTALPARRMTSDREAYALYLQGCAMGQRLGTEGAIERAIDLLERALQIDPEFAECWTALGDAHINLAALTPSLERVEHSAEGARCARRAVELDPGQGNAFSILGIHEWTQFNPARALELSYEAYARDPNNADVAVRLGSCLLYLGKSRAALPYIEEAVDRDPINGRSYAMLASGLLALGEIEKSRAAGQRVVDLGLPGMWLALAQMAAGENEHAVATHYASRVFLGSIIMRPPGMPAMDEAARDAYFDIAARGIFSGRAEDRAAYCQLIDALHASMPDPYDTSIALPAIWMGHGELVMKIYRERIHPANMFGLVNMWVDLEPINRIRQHPDFMQFAQDIGMVEAWDRFGWPDLLPADPRKS